MSQSFCAVGLLVEGKGRLGERGMHREPDTGWGSLDMWGPSDSLRLLLWEESLIPIYVDVETVAHRGCRPRIIRSSRFIPNPCFSFSTGIKTATSFLDQEGPRTGGLDLSAAAPWVSHSAPCILLGHFEVHFFLFLQECFVGTLFAPFSEWANCGSESLSDLPEITQEVQAPPHCIAFQLRSLQDKMPPLKGWGQ